MIKDGCNNNTKGYAGAKPPLRSGGNSNEDEGNMGLGAETRADSDGHDGHAPAMATLVCWGAQTRADRDTYQGGMGLGAANTGLKGTLGHGCGPMIVSRPQKQGT